MDEPESLQPSSDSQREVLEEAVAKYRKALDGSAEAAGWLKARGIGRKEADTARLGVVADPAPGHGKYRGMLSIPYLRHDGQPVAVRFRCLADHDHRELFHGKYNTIAGDPVRTYNVGAIHLADDVINVTEGEFDALVLQKVGLHAVAIPGAHSWNGRHRRMLAGFRRVYVWGDGDDAGAEFTNKVCRALRSARGVAVPQGKDVTDIYLAGGAEALYALIDKEDRPQ